MFNSNYEQELGLAVLPTFYKSQFVKARTIVFSYQLLFSSGSFYGALDKIPQAINVENSDSEDSDNGDQGSDGSMVDDSDNGDQGSDESMQVDDSDNVLLTDSEYDSDSDDGGRLVIF